MENNTFCLPWAIKHPMLWHLAVSSQQQWLYTEPRASRSHSWEPGLAAVLPIPVLDTKAMTLLGFFAPDCGFIRHNNHFFSEHLKYPGTQTCFAVLDPCQADIGGSRFLAWLSSLLYRYIDFVFLLNSPTWGKLNMPVRQMITQGWHSIKFPFTKLEHMFQYPSSCKS